jgi:5-methylcytosine-specific restriction endonuclease McrA
MIKIKVSSEKWNEIKKIHWEWYENYLEKKDIPLKDCLPNGKKNVLSFIEHYLGWDKFILEEIILAEPEMLRFLAERKNIFFEQYENAKSDPVKIQKDGWKNDQERNVGQVLKEYFGYNDFEKNAFPCNGKKWGAYEFTRLLNIDVCPYCNRQYIFTINNGDGRPQIDHFYPQSDYPYLSCSIYNFIPSCPQCNLQKGDVLNKYATKTEQQNHNEFKYDPNGRAFILYPYEDSIETKDSNGKITERKIWFSAMYGEWKKEYKLLDDSIRVQIKKKNDPLLNDKIENSIEAFHLNELYSCHKIDMEDLFTRYRNYSKPKIDEITKLILSEQLDIEIPELNKEQKKKLKEKLYKRVASTYTKRIKRTILGLPLGAEGKEYPLRKFKEDIIEQLDQTVKNMKK